MRPCKSVTNLATQSKPKNLRRADYSAQGGGKRWRGINS